MGDMLSSATSALLAFQRALDTTSHNISNVNTDGYSRQRAELVTREAQPTANGWIGNGTTVATIQRSFDQFLADQTRGTASQLQRLGTYTDNADGLNNLFSDANTGLTASLQKFVNAFQDVASAPTSIPARQVVLSQAQSFVDRLHSYDQQLTTIDNTINSRLKDEATTITTLARNIADLNQRISVDTARTGQPPNDLLDQRDQALDQLAQHVNVNVVKQDDGTLIVSIGAGQPLVVGADSAVLAASLDPYDPTRTNIAIQSLGVPTDITARLSGGTIGGLLDFRRDMLDPARNSIGRISVALADVVNQQHRAGIDLNGNFGTDLLSIGGVDVLQNSGNVGSASLAVTRTATSTLTPNDYTLEFTGGAWILRRADTGASVPYAGVGTNVSPIVADGLSIVTSGVPTNGDSFLVRPMRGAISGLSVLLNDPNQIAAAAPIRTAIGATNTGTATISGGEVLDVTNGALQTPVTLNFITPTTYQVNGVGPVIPFSSGANIDINGWRVVVNGTPAANDVFSVGPNTNPAGDNRNALKLTDALARPVLENGTVSLDADAGRLVGRIGVATNQAQVNRDAAQSIFDYNVAARDSVSGVNLDEEAATLLRYQQAYQAAAQAIKIAGTLFQTVLDATRR